MSSLYPESWQIPPMKYCSKASDKAARQAFESGDFVMQEKYDGALYQLEKTDSGYIYLFSRTKSRKTGELVEKSDNFPHIKKWAEWAIPNGTILIGEIYVEGGHSNDVTKLSGCLPQNAVKRQFDSNEYGGPVKYKVFDIIRFAGEDIQNKPTIERINNYLNNTSLDYSFSDKYVQRVTTYYDNFEERLQQIFKNGGEGAVFKNKNCPYRAGKRSTVSQAFKWKQHLDSVDLICIGLEDPIIEYTGKEIDTWPYWYSFTTDHFYKWEFDKNNPTSAPYSFDDVPDIEPVTKPFFYGWKNSMSLGCYKNGEIVYVGKVASGLTDSMRQDMAEHPKNYLNRVIQVSCMSVDPKEGTLRHPVFEQIRKDKNPEDCIYKEIFNVK